MANKENSRTGNQQGSQGGTKNPGNFANDREKASEAGRKGGQHSGGSQSSESSRKGGRS
ncbi:stress-induced protein [Pseudomonas sp. LB-090624]|uniref:general stress protein n=1 Tax=Pseudomonas sp. BN607 TaxID=2567895 RepID=UPI000D914784|nr:MULTISPECIES: KGG domain-containing protein [unclassified Pseudomonas]MCX2887831.1 stress-induced protein [Pseudomonas sp. DCB_BI]MDH4550746.1 stress-induced protein [Pseudomonas sp. BN607]PYB73669.1 stress-induced protein [Pseudomonas sp. LB-090624]